MSVLRSRLSILAALSLGGSMLAMHAAGALNIPTAATVDLGPLGSAQISGGATGYVWGVTGSGSAANPGYNGFGDSPDGADLATALVELQKSTGVVQYTLMVGPNGGATTLGTKPAPTTISAYSLGPIYRAYITIAPPNTNLSISIGQIASLEGWESGIDWYNSNQLTTELYYPQAGNGRGVEAAYTAGPLTATASFGDGFDTGVFNYAQALVDYTINANNNVNVYYGGNLGRTGLNAHTYGSAAQGYTATTVAYYGANYINAQIAGAWYSWTDGNLNLVPEVQYAFAKADQKIGLTKSSSNFGATVIATYNFGTSPYSIGAFAEYFSSQGPDYWFIAPGAAGEGVSVSPTWQYKNLFARADAGVLYLNAVSNQYDSAFGYGESGSNHFQVTGTLEAGLLF
jgi:hypothetical protein